LGKIVIRLTGGLGNQMHQYAFGIYLRKHTGYELFIDDSFLNLNAHWLNITQRYFELYPFNVEKKTYKGLLTNYYLNLLLNKNSLLRLFLFKVFRVKNLYNNSFDIIELEKSRMIYVVGVFGTIFQYEDVKYEIDNVFGIAIDYNKLKEDVKSLIIKKNSLAIHVRRSDYLRPDSIHAVLNLDYYKKAIETIRMKVSNCTVYLFGDDEEWIKSNLLTLLPEAIFINRKGDNSALFDFLAISHCENIITSNSTFAWWAAFLNLKSKKNIVAPLNWFKNKNCSFIEKYPEDWIKI